MYVGWDAFQCSITRSIFVWHFMWIKHAFSIIFAPHTTCFESCGCYFALSEEMPSKYAHVMALFLYLFVLLCVQHIHIYIYWVWFTHCIALHSIQMCNSSSSGILSLPRKHFEVDKSNYLIQWVFAIECAQLREITICSGSNQINF